MNIANKLTVLRVILVPFYVFFMLTTFVPKSELIALIIFCVATITDKLDGTIAKKYNMVTNFGKFMDPIADKLLVCSALICLCAKGVIPAVITIIIIGREFIISAIRLIACENGVKIAASWWGKSKTISQMTMIIVFLVEGNAANLSLGIFPDIIMYIATVLTIISLFDYAYKNRKALNLKDM
ncbi:MAG: CDP-diacylglycerol--glycerol-3-phosphate 3-phosphatidyltransferase [Acutalibacteraceae bacterium]